MNGGARRAAVRRWIGRLVVVGLAMSVAMADVGRLAASVPPPSSEPTTTTATTTTTTVPATTSTTTSTTIAPVTTVPAPTTTSQLADGDVTAAVAAACVGTQAVFRVTVSTTVALVDAQITAETVDFEAGPTPLSTISTGPVAAGASFTAEFPVDGGAGYSAFFYVAWAGQPPGTYVFVDETSTVFAKVCDPRPGSPELTATAVCSGRGGAIDVTIVNPAGGDEPTDLQVTMSTDPFTDAAFQFWSPGAVADGGMAEHRFWFLPAGDYRVDFTWGDSSGRPLESGPFAVTVGECPGLPADVTTMSAEAVECASATGGGTIAVQVVNGARSRSSEQRIGLYSGDASPSSFMRMVILQVAPDAAGSTRFAGLPAGRYTVDLIWPVDGYPRFARDEATVVTCPDDIEASAILPATR